MRRHTGTHGHSLFLPPPEGQITDEYEKIGHGRCRRLGLERKWTAGSKCEQRQRSSTGTSYPLYLRRRSRPRVNSK